MKPTKPFKKFTDLTIKLSKLNKSFLSCVEDELLFNGIYEINATQALMLKNIGEDKSNVSKTTTQGYYLGKNLSYNSDALLKKGYLTKQVGISDKRCVYLVLTKKGSKVLGMVNNALLTQQESLTKIGIRDNSIENINIIIDKLQRVLDNNIRIQ
jgi:DNA-binding MarR family transcriptional regulator